MGLDDLIAKFTKNFLVNVVHFFSPFLVLNFSFSFSVQNRALKMHSI